MKFSEFKIGLEKGDNRSSIYLFEGEDAYFRERGLSALKKRFLSEPSLNLSVFNGADFSDSEFSSSLEAYPFMSEKRLMVIREFYPKKGSCVALERFAQNPAESSVLIILNEKTCDYLKKLSNVCDVDCSKADISVLTRWIKATCYSHGVEIKAETASSVANFCLCDMTRISNETEKLISYAGNGGVIDDIAVELLVPRDSEYKIYEMTDYISKKKFDLAYSVICDMLGKGETPQRIIASVYNYFRRLLFAAISSKPPIELAKLFGIKEYAATKTISQAKSFKIRALKKNVDMLTDYDYKIKSGLIDSDEAMWISVFAIMTDAVK